jgi:hypothetical protein
MASTNSYWSFVIRCHRARISAGVGECHLPRYFSMNVIGICVQDLENYILELLPTLPQLDGLEKSFHSFYVCTAVRKFFFFLDPLRTGRIRIQDVLACSFLDDLLEVSIIECYNDFWGALLSNIVIIIICPLH